MELIWWIVVIAGCVALAGCVVYALLWPQHVDRQRMRPLANTGRLTRLPEYLRAVRLRTLTACVSIALLVTAFAAAILVTARPTGLPSTTQNSEALAPEDIMVCVGGPVSEPAVGATLRYFAQRVTSFGTERIGLTSANRRVVPLTRDYQYAAAQFAAYAQPVEQQDGEPFIAPVSYVDYAENVEDVLALCLTGFPSFDEKTPQRRSLIYVGPQSLPGSGDAKLFTADRIGEMATAAGIQVNVLATDPGGGPLEELARSTGGRSFEAGATVDGQLDDIRDHPPSAASSGGNVTRAVETPDVGLVVALLAVVALSLWPVVIRR
ncbi:hypothetical protein ACRCUN_07615 [Mycobacterium sp. LTG2003]